jgi:hypothetical protein
VQDEKCGTIVKGEGHGNDGCVVIVVASLHWDWGNTRGQST